MPPRSPGGHGSSRRPGALFTSMSWRYNWGWLLLAWSVFLGPCEQGSGGAHWLAWVLVLPAPGSTAQPPCCPHAPQDGSWGRLASTHARRDHTQPLRGRGLRIPEARPRGAWWEGRIMLCMDVYLEKQSIRDSGKQGSVGWIDNFYSALPHHQALRVSARPPPGPWASLVAPTVKNLPVMTQDWVGFLGWEDPLEKGMATHPSILAWRIPWTEEPGGLQSMGSQRVGHDWTTFKVRSLGLWGLRFMATWVFGHRERLVRMASDFRLGLG